jgi:hypothetical protein
MLGLGLTTFKNSTPLADADVGLFLAAVANAGGTVNNDIRVAVTNIVADLKGYGPNNTLYEYWYSGKLERMWPVVGGVAAAHAIELKTRTSGVFGGGWTHTPAGMKSNGTTGFFNTIFNNSTMPNSLLGGFGFYITATASTNFNGYAGGVIGTPSTFHAISNSNVGNVAYFGWKDGINTSISGDSNGIGDYQTDRLSTTQIVALKNQVGGIQNVNSRVGNPTDPIYFGAINDGGVLLLPRGNTFVNCRITYNLSLAEATMLQLIVNQFQTTLGRSVY